MTRVWLAGTEDAPAVADLLVEFRDWWGRSSPSADSLRASVDRLLGDPHTDFLLGAVARSESAAPDGVCQLRYRWGIWRAGEDCCLEDLYVREAARGAGLGRALADAAVARARERGCVRMDLDVSEENAAALALYASLGFRSGDGPGARSLFMRLPLDE